MAAQKITQSKVIGGKKYYYQMGTGYSPDAARKVLAKFREDHPDMLARLVKIEGAIEDWWAVYARNKQ